MIDAHCHLDLFSEIELPSVVQRALNSGITGAVLGGVWLNDARRIVDWSENRGFCTNAKVVFANKSLSCLPLETTDFVLFASLGLHPWHQWEHWSKSDGTIDANKMDADFRATEEILLRYPELFWAIGETGMDLSRLEFADKKLRASMQLAAFEFCIDLANRTSLPLIIHSRGAWKATIDTLQKHREAHTRVLFHCFSGSADSISGIEDEGVFASFGGVATWTNASRVRKAVQKCPAKMLVLETDAPDLPPEFADGTHPVRNEPSFLREITNTIALLRRENATDLTRSSDGNIARFLGFPLAVL